MTEKPTPGEEFVERAVEMLRADEAEAEAERQKHEADENARRERVCNGEEPARPGDESWWLRESVYRRTPPGPRTLDEQRADADRLARRHGYLPMSPETAAVLREFAYEERDRVARDIAAGRYDD
ncbi:hypothetical protein [Micromonospora sp. NPDC023956]|uniref:hypothetical protein n=1 Tax=Micromonospora sp. NPDC023956 TaxID=3155722 RepID=UPI0033F45C4C